MYSFCSRWGFVYECNSETNIIFAKVIMKIKVVRHVDHVVVATHEPRAVVP